MLKGINCDLRKHDLLFNFMFIKFTRVCAKGGILSQGPGSTLSIDTAERDDRISHKRASSPQRISYKPFSWMSCLMNEYSLLALLAA